MRTTIILTRPWRRCQLPILPFRIECACLCVPCVCVPCLVREKMCDEVTPLLSGRGWSMSIAMEGDGKKKKQEQKEKREIRKCFTCLGWSCIFFLLLLLVRVGQVFFLFALGFCGGGWLLTFSRPQSSPSNLRCGCRFPFRSISQCCGQYWVAGRAGTRAKGAKEGSPLW